MSLPPAAGRLARSQCGEVNSNRSRRPELCVCVTCQPVLFVDELLLPHMKRVDGLITDNRKRLLHKLHIGQVLKVGVSPLYNLRATPGNGLHNCFRL